MTDVTWLDHETLEGGSRTAPTGAAPLPPEREASALATASGAGRRATVRLVGWVGLVELVGARFFVPQNDRRGVDGRRWGRLVVDVSASSLVLLVTTRDS